jgi:hypothetical protein
MVSAAVVAFALAGAPDVFTAPEPAPAIVEVSISAAADLVPGVVQDGGDPRDGQQQSDADTKAEQKKPPTPPHTGVRALLDGLKQDVAHLPTWSNAYFAALGGGLALGAHPSDQDFNAHLRSHYDLVNALFAPGKYFGNTPEQLGLSIGTYFVGRAFDQPKTSHLGMDLLRAQALTEMMVEPLKLATHRERPDKSNHLAFPSGHSAVTFAGATVLERHLGWRRSLLGYAIASYVAASRLHDNRHYLSDVLFGAAVGTIAGRTVTEHGPEVWTFMPARVPGGVALMAARGF